MLMEFLAAAAPALAEAGADPTLTKNLIALATLATLEIILGIDNIVVIAIVTAKLPAHQQKKARNVGLFLAALMRIVLLLFIGWIMKLTAPIFTIFGNELSGKDLVLIGGGLFLLYKAVHEIHDKIEGPASATHPAKQAATTFGAALATIVGMDAVFSLDSVITAVGMADTLWVMIVAVLMAVGVMIIFAGKISSFIENHPTIKILALSFLMLIGVVLIVEGLDGHIGKKTIYFSMGFALMVELINLRIIKQYYPKKYALSPDKKSAAETAKMAPGGEAPAAEG